MGGQGELSFGVRGVVLSLVGTSPWDLLCLLKHTKQKRFSARTPPVRLIIDWYVRASCPFRGETLATGVSAVRPLEHIRSSPHVACRGHNSQGAAIR